MAGVPAGLPAGVRVSDHISLGVIAKTFPPDRVQQVLAETGKASERERDLPAQVMVYYAVAMALYMGSSTREVLRCLLEGLRWLWGADAVKVAGKSGISQARSRLGEMPLRRLYEQVVLCSKTPDLVRQEFWGLLLAHFAVRGLMHEAALRADEDPDRLSFLHAVRVVRRKLPLLAAFPPSTQARPA